MNQQNIERTLRGLAGLFTLISTLLFFLHSEYWMGFIAFIGINLLQSAFTKWCPMITILKKLFPKKDEV